MKSAIILLFIPLILGMIDQVYVVNGSSESEINCYEKGFRVGEEYPFNQNTYDDCGDDYYRGFIKGCMSVEGNKREACELATDAQGKTEEKESTKDLLKDESKAQTYTKINGAEQKVKEYSSFCYNQRLQAFAEIPQQGLRNDIYVDYKEI